MADGAGNREWVKGSERDCECGGESEGGAALIRDESTPSRRGKNRPVLHNMLENGRGRRDRSAQDETKCIQGDVGSGANPRLQRGLGFTPLKTLIDSSTITRFDAGSAECSALRTEHQKSETMSHSA